MIHSQEKEKKKGSRRTFKTSPKSAIICFEKILSASSVSCPGNALPLPAWFVKEHGDKFRKSVLLRSKFSAKKWTVKLAITHLSPSCCKVKFSGGWKEFVTFHGFLAGDLLVFSLTAMSEFTVSVLPGARNDTLLHRSPESSQEEAYENKDHVAVPASSCTPSFDSNSKGFLHRPESPGSIRFDKNLTPSNVSKRGKATLALPARFVKEHGDKFRKSVILRSDSSARSWTVNLTVEYRSPISSQVKFSGGWKAFVAFHGLAVGDFLVFSLTAISEFKVSVLHSTGKRLGNQ